MVRSPSSSPSPDVPIIMLTGHGDRWRVVEAARLGAHEYLLKPVSTKALLDRIVAILNRPRPMVKKEGYYGPAPRRPAVIGSPVAPRPAPASDEVKPHRPSDIMLVN